MLCLEARSYLIVGWLGEGGVWLYIAVCRGEEVCRSGTVFTSLSVHKPFSLAVGVHKWLWLAVLVWRKANEASVCVCVNLLGPDLKKEKMNFKKKKKGWQDWTHKVLIYFYMCRDILFLFFFFSFFLSFAPFFLMRSHFILGTVFSSVHTVCLDQFCTRGE